MVHRTLSQGIWSFVRLMLIYGNTPRDIIKKIQSKLNGKGLMKIILITTVLVIGYFGLVKAEEKTYTPTETLTAFSEVPGKVANHISNEIQATKDYQAKSWAEAKAQWSELFKKFQAKQD